MTTLHAVNAIRVIAEFSVVRTHTFADNIGMSNFVTDLMSFFFVLSGFVMMHSHYSDCFATTSRKCDFWVGRWKKAYPAYILNYAFYFHLNFVSDPCPYHRICSMMQIVALNAWFGCGITNVLNLVSWYIATLAWIWFSFPFMHSTLKTFFSAGRVWLKMFVVNALAVAAIYPLSGYEILTYSTLPILRLGEFIIGCGAACALHNLEPTEGALTRRHWVPMTLILLYIAVLYTLFALPHGLESLCVHELNYNTRCSLWETSKWIEAKSPCLLVWDKYINKHALLWAVVIHTVATAERSCDESPLIRLLTHDLFKSLNAFSLSMYLGHMHVDWVLRNATDALGWLNFWHDDTRILAIYALCYLLHLITLKLSSAVFKHAFNYTPVPSPTQV